MQTCTSSGLLGNVGESVKAMGDWIQEIVEEDERVMETGWLERMVMIMNEAIVLLENLDVAGREADRLPKQRWRTWG